MRLRPRGTASAPDGVDENLAEVLTELEESDNYRAWLLDVLRPHLGGALLEIGAGSGSYTSALRAASTEVVAVEPSETISALLRQQVGSIEGVEIVAGTLDAVSRRDFDVAVALNVVEHIDDDIAFLEQIRTLLRPGGTVLIWVPAFESLYGDFDRSIGHHRRYRRRQLIDRLGRSGFEVVQCRYYNLPGFFAWWLVVRVLGRRPTTRGLAGVYDRWIVPPTRWVERRFSVPFGQSVFAAARRPTSDVVSEAT